MAVTFQSAHIRAAGVFLFVGLGCSPEVPSLPRIVGSDRVIVLATYGDTLGVITDSVRIRALEAFANARADGWARPWDGIAVFRVRADFYANGRLRAHFGAAAERWFNASLPGGQGTRPATVEELEEFRALTGVAPETFKALFK